jgi:hypothetical protein
MAIFKIGTSNGYINQHKFVHYLHLAGVHFKFLQVSISNFAGVHFKFCRCSFQILQVSISNFAGVHFKFAHHNFVGA